MLRMSSRRFARLTSGYSRKAENHAHAVSLPKVTRRSQRPSCRVTAHNIACHAALLVPAGP